MRTILAHIHRKTWLAGLVTFIGLSMMSTAWAIATPLSASPDEPAHIIKAAAVVRGQLIGKTTGKSGFTAVTVPSAVGNAWGWTCPAYHPDTTADCQAIRGDATQRRAVTSAGLYNPTYYFLVGWPSLFTSEPHAAVYSMRILSGLICSFFFAVAFASLLLFRRPFVAGLAVLAVVTPTTAFLSGSVNPNALEVATGSALLALLLLLVRGASMARPGIALALVAVSGLLLANARGLSPLWMAMIAVLVLVAALPGRIRALFRGASAWATLAVLAIGGGFAVFWILFTGTLSNMGQFAGAGATTPLQAFIAMTLDKSPDLGMIALFGWLDTSAPPFIYALWSFLALAVTLTAVIIARGRLLIATLLSVGAFFFIPAAVQALSVQHTGYIWQGRYSLVAYASVLVVSAVAIGQRHNASALLGRPLISRAAITLGGTIALGEGFAAAAALKRYAVGADQGWGTFLLHPHWQAPGTNLLWILVVVVGAALVGLTWLAQSRTTCSTETADSSARTGSPEYPVAAR